MNKELYVSVLGKCKWIDSVEIIESGELVRFKIIIKPNVYIDPILVQSIALGLVKSDDSIIVTKMDNHIILIDTVKSNLKEFNIETNNLTVNPDAASLKRPNPKSIRSAIERRNAFKDMIKNQSIQNNEDCPCYESARKKNTCVNIDALNRKEEHHEKESKLHESQDNIDIILNNYIGLIEQLVDVSKVTINDDNLIVSLNSNIIVSYKSTHIALYMIRSMFNNVISDGLDTIFIPKFKDNIKIYYKKDQTKKELSNEELREKIKDKFNNLSPLYINISDSITVIISESNVAIDIFAEFGIRTKATFKNNVPFGKITSSYTAVYDTEAIKKAFEE